VATATGIGVRAYAPGYSVPEKILSYTFSVQAAIANGRDSADGIRWQPGTEPVPAQASANKVGGLHDQCPNGRGDSGARVWSAVRRIDYKTVGGTDHYDSLQTTLNRRFRKGLTLGVQWTWGHSIGDSGGSNEATRRRILTNFRADSAAIIAFDVRHSANISTMYELPFGEENNSAAHERAANAIVGGWDLVAC